MDGRTGRGGGRIRELTGRVGGRTGDQDGQGGGFSYKEFLACKPNEFDGKGSAIAYTRWTEKKESVHNMSGCGNHQKIRGMVATMEPTIIHSAILKSKVLTDESIKNGSLKKNTKNRGNGRELSRDENVRDDKKRYRTRRAFATTTNLVRKELRPMVCVGESDLGRGEVVGSDESGGDGGAGVWITTRSAGRSIATPRGGRTDGRTGRGGGRIRELTGRVGGRTGDQDGQGGNHVNNQGNNGNQNDNVVNENIKVDFHTRSFWHVNQMNLMSAILKAKVLTDESIKNGSLKKNTKNRGNGRELSRDGNVRDDK
nr:reverse transcriptase domain-containing protein [Tanacetum cinerariifolium]